MDYYDYYCPYYEPYFPYDLETAKQMWEDDLLLQQQYYEEVILPAEQDKSNSLVNLKSNNQN